MDIPGEIADKLKEWANSIAFLNENQNALIAYDVQVTLRLSRELYEKARLWARN